ncbi:enoyl-CoA hydratase [Rhodococcus sp. D2-41]|uniref:Enoyl-CoA hydratase-related protein n=1 Tax=Speluncibacter jeojiensis TaxID=2710754 RepID=A0A9X4RE61_9ACTN|nr:enoyl-CoA hydratase-related protein [Rhodococcus sp. D2-41]MDG3009048.1 enoyl-CoA hydratase [Rhodococcus sp. D2-41]MDG3015560.1 enoyl-CoA hydratase-related protein [Corynebacteriales bacterium D3-21]
MTAAAASGLRVERDGPVLRVVIDRPRRMNAFDLAHMRALLEVLIAVPGDDSVRVVVIAGAGAAFSTGADLAAMAEGERDGSGPVSPEVVMDAANSVIRAIVDLPVPVIAEVPGAAAGVGASIAVAADLAYAAESAYLLLAFVNVGLMPDGGSTALISASVGRARAARMALLGERLPADEALRAGLIAGVLPEAELSGHVAAVAHRLASGPRRAIELTKRALTAVTLDRLDAAMAAETRGQCELLVGPEFAEGATAMLQHRPPSFP